MWWWATEAPPTQKDRSGQLSETSSHAEMKAIGLVDGMSWHASAYYYRLLNEVAEERYGSQHNARSVMETLCFAPLLNAV